MLVIIMMLNNIGYLTAQNATDTFKNNSIFLSAGSIIFSNQVSIAYERELYEVNNWRTRIKANFGSYLSNNADYDTNAILYRNYFSLSGVQLVGLLEVNAGVAFAHYTLARGFNPDPMVNYDEVNNKIVFYGNLGIRYVKHKFLFRAGLGNLELLYIGIGVNF